MNRLEKRFLTFAALVAEQVQKRGLVRIEYMLVDSIFG